MSADGGRTADRGTVLFVNTRLTALEADPCFAAAAARGLRVVLLADRPSTAPPGLLAEHVTVDTYDVDACVAAAREVAARRGDVRGVVTWGDRDVVPAAAIAEDLGLPGPGLAAARTARDKHATRRALHAARPDLVPRFRPVTDEASLTAAVEHVGFPAVLKPTGASASRGIFAVDDAGQARDALAELSRFTRPESDPIFRQQAGALILEERLGGSEHSIEGIAVDGELVAAFVTDKWVREPFFLEYRQVAGSRLADGTRALLVDAARDVVRAVGFRTGAFHLEVRVEAEDRVRVLELNARTGGNYITSHLVPWSTGYGFLDNVLAAATGEAVAPAVDPVPALVAGSLQVIDERSGKLLGIDRVDAALSMPGVRAFTYEATPGTTVAQPPASYSTSIVASLLAVAGTAEHLVELLDRASAVLRVRVE